MLKKIIKPKKHRRIVVFGGTGFIGANFIRKCLSNNLTNIIIANSKKQKQEIKRVKYITCDFTNKKAILNLIKRNDIVCHFACTTIPQSSEDNIVQDLQSNLVGTVQLLEVCATKKIAKFIFLSSGGTVYGEIKKSFAVKESEKLNPICAHGVMKISCENYIKFFAKKYKFKFLIFRLANPYGRIFNKTRFQGLIDFVLHHAINNIPVKIWGSLNKTRDFIHIDDVCDLLLLSLNKNINGSCFNVGSGKSKTIRSIIKTIEKICKRKIKIEKYPQRPFDCMHNRLDISKTKKHFHWFPQIDIYRGIQRIHSQYLENFNNNN